jgi:hypothetical protein
LAEHIGGSNEPSHTGSLALPGLATSAQANVIFIQGNDPSQIVNNVLFDDSPTGSLILGDLNGPAPDNVITFTSSTDQLRTMASGQANVEAVSGGINQLTIGTVSPFIGFEAIQLAVQGSAGTTITFTANDNMGGPFVSGPILLTNANTTFTFNTDALQFITSLSFTATGAGVANVRQVGVGALVVPGPVAGAGLPVLMALGGLVWARRRKATAATA